MESLKAVCFGEVLWDVFPDEERIGGAPLNVASRLSNLGLKTEMISKVGNDEKGCQILSYLQSKKIENKNIIKDPRYSTGVVNVTLSSSGSATYDITHPVAWDKIDVTKEIINSVKAADIFIFGSLVCRDKVSENSLFNLLPYANYRVLDCNLRHPFYQKEVLLNLIKHANFIKFNDDELFEVAALMNSPYNSLEQNLNFIAERSTADTICITKGRHGAVLYRNNKLFYNSGFKIKVKDTVGAGDSFLATLLVKLLADEAPQKALDFACAVGALVASEKGANPELDPLRIQQFMEGSPIS